MMDLKSQYRIRVESCIGTIIDVHKSLGTDYENQEVLSQFEKIKTAIEDMDMRLLCEGDILMVEKATNALLREFKVIFEMGELGPIYTQAKH